MRELQNLIERAVIRSNNGVLPNPLPDKIPMAEAETVTVIPTQGTFRDSQRALILRALQEAGWVVGGPAGAAARLGLKRTTLIAKMKKLGISRATPFFKRIAPAPSRSVVPWHFKRAETDTRSE